LFGQTIANYVNAVWERLGRPEPFVVCEVAAGSGTLLEPLLEHLEMPAHAVAVEASAAAREALARRVPHAEVVAVLDDVPQRFDGVIIANELLDNIPMALAVRRGSVWTERWVTEDADGGFAFVEAAARPEVIAWLHRWAGPVSDGGIVEVQTRAASWLRSCVGHLDAGALVVFDYGDTAEGLARRRVDGTLRTYQAHHLGPHPLTMPGTVDITGDVNFSAVADVLSDLGAAVRVERQAHVLRSWGLGEQRDRLRDRELELARAGEGLERLVVKTRVTEADTLLHPRGLGDFTVAIAEFGLGAS
jgi:SAM-dependent MidA family methyltransferase